MNEDNTSLSENDVEVIDPGLNGKTGEREGMAEIIAKAKKQREIDGAAPGETMQVYGGDPTEQERSQNNVDPLQNAIKVKVKVDGEEFNVDSSIVEAAGGIKTYQLEQSALKKLEKSKEVLRQAREEAANIEREALQKAQREASLAKNSTSSQTSDGDYSDDQLVEMLYSADEERAKEAIRVIRKQGQSQAVQPINTDEIVAKATQKALWEADRRAANEAFRKNYTDITAHPALVGEVNHETAQLKTLHPEWTPRQIIESAADTVRERHSDFLSKHQSQIPNDMENRLAQKRAMDSVQGANAAAQKQPERKPLTRAEIVANMQRSRGL